jgi:hypothetical protein
MKKTENNIEVQFQYYESFYSIAVESYKHILRICSHRDKKKVITDRDIDFICECNAQIERLAISSVVFSCMCLESFINCYGISHYSKTYFENYLDKLDLKSKWIIIPRLINGLQLETESIAFKNFSELIKLRNKLVHDKPKTKKVSRTLASDWITENEAKLSVETVQNVLTELKKIDNKTNIKWTNTLNGPSA